MKQWLETRQVLGRLAELREEGKRAALATVVRVRGSAYRREGAKLLVAEQGGSIGNVSGGCLEEDVREVGLQVLATGRPQLRSYCSGADEISAWDLGVGCEGEVQIYVEPAPESVEWERSLLEGSAPFAVCTRLLDGDPRTPAGRLVVTAEEQRGGLGSPEIDALATARAREMLVTAPSGMHVVEGVELFFDLFAPPPRLVVLGAGDDARPLARLALDMGFRVTVVDRRPGLLEPERFPERVQLVRSDAAHLADRLALDEACYAVVMTHSYADDERFLRALLPFSLPYIGMLGPRQRTERILASVEAECPVDRARVHGPVGLDIGSEGAEQVALSIVGEILAVRARRRARPLRERMEPIHASSA